MGQYQLKIDDGTLKSEVVKNDHLKNPRKVDEPWCTHSQIINYFDGNGHLIVTMHQFLRQDGRLGASGMPDPKRLKHNGIIYYVSSVRT